jgi:hypothetical protein
VAVAGAIAFLRPARSVDHRSALFAKSPRKKAAIKQIAVSPKPKEMSRDSTEMVRAKSPLVMVINLYGLVPLDK